MTALEMEEALKRIRGVTELPRELLEDIQRDTRASIVNFMTEEELNREEDRVIEELNEKLSREEDEEIEDLTIYDEEDLTEEEMDELPSGALVRKRTGTINLKILDIWIQYIWLRRPEEPLTKYGRMRLRFLEQWRVKQALEWDRDLLIHCLEIQRRAKETKQRLIEQLQRNDPPPSKSEDAMAWVRHMNALELQAEEIVTRTIVYS